MAAGLTGSQEGPLERFAARFVAAGWAVVSFDYRTCGGSGGEPRHWIDPFRQAEDYRAVLDFVRGPLAERGWVDPRRIALWGSSFSGGVALWVAAERPAGVRGVIVQAPFLRTPESQQPRAGSCGAISPG